MPCALFYLNLFWEISLKDVLARVWHREEVRFAKGNQTIIGRF